MSEPISAPGRSSDAPIRGGRWILIVDDETTVLNLLATVLRRIGHHTVLASSPEQGIAIACEPAASLDLVITDITMPGMSGVEMVRRIRETRPDIPVLYLSGDPDTALARWGVQEADLLSKPFGIDVFRDRIQAIFDR